MRKKAGKASMSWVVWMEAWWSAVKWCGGGKTLLSRAICLQLKSERTLLSLMEFFRESTTFLISQSYPFIDDEIAVNGRSAWLVARLTLRPSRLIAWFSGQFRSTTLAANHVCQSSVNLSRFRSDSQRLALTVVYASMHSLVYVNAS